MDKYSTLLLVLWHRKTWNNVYVNMESKSDLDLLGPFYTHVILKLNYLLVVTLLEGTKLPVHMKSPTPRAKSPKTTTWWRRMKPPLWRPTAARPSLSRPTSSRGQNDFIDLDHFKLNYTRSRYDNLTFRFHQPHIFTQHAKSSTVVVFAFEVVGRRDFAISLTTSHHMSHKSHHFCFLQVFQIG